MNPNTPTPSPSPTPASEPSDVAKQAMNCAEDITELVRGNPRDGGSRVFQAAITLRIEEAITTARAEDAQRIAKLDRIEAAVSADAEDLKKMRDGTKLTRSGLVEIIAFQSEDLKEQAQRIAELEKERDESANAHAVAMRREDVANVECAELRETIDDLQCCVTQAERRANDRQEELDAIKPKLLANGEPQDEAVKLREMLEAVRRERDEYKHAYAPLEMVLEAVSERRQEALAAGLENLSAMNRIEKERDTLRTALAEAQRQAQEAGRTLEVLTQEREQFIQYCQSLELATGQVGPIQVARMHIERLSNVVAAMELLTAMEVGDEPAQCPECRSTWSEREVTVMRRRMRGSCICGKWSFDIARHAAGTTEDAK